MLVLLNEYLVLSGVKLSELSINKFLDSFDFGIIIGFVFILGLHPATMTGTESASLDVSISLILSLLSGVFISWSMSEAQSVPIFILVSLVSNKISSPVMGLSLLGKLSFSTLLLNLEDDCRLEIFFGIVEMIVASVSARSRDGES